MTAHAGGKGMPCSTACLHGSCIECPLLCRHRISFGSCSQRLHTATRHSWSAVLLDHRGDGVCRCWLIDPAGQLDLCRVALLSLQSHYLLCLDCPHAAWDSF